MKTSYLFAAVGLAACAVEPVETEGTADLAAGAPAAGAPAAADDPSDDAIPVPSMEIARVRLAHGDLVFRAPSEEETVDGTAPAGRPAVDVGEISRPDANGRVQAFARDASPLESFLATTSATVPVPRRLLDNEPSDEIRGRAAGRAVVTAISAPITGLPPSQLGLPVAAIGNVATWCTGTTSASFASDVCTLTNWDVDFCHNGTWYSVTDEVGSSNKRRDSRSRTLACGANGRVRHYYRLGGVWYKPLDEAIPSSSLVRWTRHGSWALQRKITHSRTASGFVRGASHFNIPF